MRGEYSSTIKLNDINLYSSGLGITNAIQALFKKKYNRGVITVILGLIGTFLSTIGILDQFTNFLVFLGVAIPPVAGIIVIDYYLLKRDRHALDESRKSAVLPENSESWNPLTFIAWICAFLVGYFIQWGIPALNSLITALVLYFVMMKIAGAVQKKPFVAFNRTEEI